MTTPEPSLAALESPLDAAIVDGLQSGFPVAERPYRVVGARLGHPEERVLARVRHLHEQGVFRRVGPVLNPPVIGSSALAALSAPEGAVDEVAAVVNGYDEVNHNYRRDHRYDVWFVVTAATRSRRDAVLDGIEAHTDCPVLRLPMRTEYDVDLEFPVVNDDSVAREGDAGTAVEPTPVGGDAGDLTPLERRVVVAVQDGFPLSPTPYRDVAADLGEPVEAVLDAVDGLLARNCIKRIGCVVNHHAVGFDANCMVAWDVPGDRLDERGVAAGRQPFVTYCCHRPRRPAADWPYNLFTMVHGRSRDAVAAAVDELAAEHVPHDHARLHTAAVLKQTGVRYTDLLDTAGG